MPLLSVLETLCGFVGILVLTVFWAAGAWYVWIYVTHRSALPIRSRNPDLLIVEVAIMVFQATIILQYPIRVGLTSGSAMATGYGKPLPCWLPRLAFSLFWTTQFMATTVLPCLVLLVKFDKRMRAHFLLGRMRRTRPRQVVLLLSLLPAAMLSGLFEQAKLCGHTLCRPPEGQACLYGAEWIWIVAVYPINVFVIVLLLRRMRKVVAQSDLHGLSRTMETRNYYLLVGTTLVLFCDLLLDYEVVSGPLWTIAQSAVCMIVPISHFYHGHMLPSRRFGYAPPFLESIDCFNPPETRRIVPVTSESPRPDEGGSHDSSSIHGPLSYLSHLVTASPGGPNGSNNLRLPLIRDMRPHGHPAPAPSSPRSRPALQRTLSTSLRSNRHGSLGLPSFSAFDLALKLTPEEREQLYRTAKLSLIEEATRFTLGVCELRKQPLVTDNREVVRTMCSRLKVDHCGPEAPYQLDISYAAEAQLVHEVTKLSRRKVLFEDDCRVAVRSFFPAMLEVEEPVKQLLITHQDMFGSTEAPVIDEHWVEASTPLSPSGNGRRISLSGQYRSGETPRSGRRTSSTSQSTSVSEGSFGNVPGRRMTFSNSQATADGNGSSRDVAHSVDGHPAPSSHNPFPASLLLPRRTSSASTGSSGGGGWPGEESDSRRSSSSSSSGHGSRRSSAMAEVLGSTRGDLEEGGEGDGAMAPYYPIKEEEPGQEEEEERARPPMLSTTLLSQKLEHYQQEVVMGARRSGRVSSLELRGAPEQATGGGGGGGGGEESHAQQEEQPRGGEETAAAGLSPRQGSDGSSGANSRRCSPIVSPISRSPSSRLPYGRQLAPLNLTPSLPSPSLPHPSPRTSSFRHLTRTGSFKGSQRSLTPRSSLKATTPRRTSEQQQQQQQHTPPDTTPRAVTPAEATSPLSGMPPPRPTFGLENRTDSGTEPESPAVLDSSLTACP